MNIEPNIEPNIYLNIEPNIEPNIGPNIEINESHNSYMDILASEFHFLSNNTQVIPDGS